MTLDSSKGESAISAFTRRMQSAGGDVSARFAAVGQSVTNVGQNIAGVGGQLTRGITAPAAGAALAVGGITAALGWGRLKSIDTAQAQLRGLGYDTQDVERISGQLAEALKGGMLTMGEATSAAASGMAAGVAEGKELTRYIQLLDAATAGSNGTFDEMNQIFARVQGSGQLMSNELDMMEQRMAGFTGLMAEAAGVTQDEFRQMVAAGEVSADEFLDLFETFGSGMATEYAKSWEGMVQNTKANVGIIGAALLGGVFEQSKDSIAEFLDFLEDEKTQAWAAETGTAIGNAFTKILAGVRSVIEWFMNLPAPVQKVGLAFGAVAVAAGPVLLIIGNIVAAVGTAITAFGTIMGVLSKIPAPLNILGGLFRMVSPLLSILGKGVMLVTGALRALWLTMLANPIVLIIAAVAAVIAALVWFFTQTETGKAIWQGFVDWLVGAWEWVRDKTAEIWNAVVDWIRDNWDRILDILSLANPVTAVIRHWDTIKAATGAAWQWVKDKIAALWEGIKTAIRTAADWVKNRVTTVWNAIKTVNQTIWNGIKSTISNVWNTVKRTVLGALNNVKNTINRGWNNAKNLTTNAWNTMRNAVSNGISGVVNFVRGLPGRILSALGSLGSMLYNSGWSMIDGLRRGIVNGFNNAVNAVRNGLNRIRRFFPFSPAKEGPFSGSGWTFNSGKSITEALAAGMEAREGTVVAAAEQIARAAAFDPATVPGMTVGARGGQHQADSGGPAHKVTFNITNPVAEPTSETARKASAYIGVSV